MRPAGCVHGHAGAGQARSRGHISAGTPAEPLVRVRQAIRDAIGDVWGLDRVPEPADRFRPHVSLGYSNSAGPAEPVAKALAEHGEHTAEVTVSAVSLIDLNRDRKAYEWTDVASVRL